MTTNTQRCLTPDELTDTLIRIMEACLRKLRTMETVSAADREALLGLLSGMDVTGYRSAEKRSLVVDIRRECNRI
jgi:hypothetical protein